MRLLQAAASPIFGAPFALLNRGHRIAAIGSSDTHDVNRFILGQGVVIDNLPPSLITKVAELARDQNILKEARDRVRAALQNAQFEFPQRKVTVNLAPADLPKESGRYDLPIALGILGGMLIAELKWKQGYG